MKKLETTIPIEVATSGLTLEEIGVICVLMLSPNLPEKNKMSWGTNEIFQTVLRGLEKRGVVEMEGVNMKINLEDKRPNTKQVGMFEYDADFWDVEYDKESNPIFSHPSNYGDDGVSYLYKYTPILRDGDIYFDNISDDEIFGDMNYWEISLEDAKKEIKISLDEEVKEISETNETLEFMDEFLHKNNYTLTPTQHSKFEFWLKNQTEETRGNDVILLAFLDGILSN